MAQLQQHHLSQQHGSNYPGHGRRLQLQKHMLNYTAAHPLPPCSGLQGSGEEWDALTPRNPHPAPDSLQVPTVPSATTPLH